MSKKAVMRKDYGFILLPIAFIFASGFIYGLYADDPLIRIITKPSVLMTFMIYMLCSANFSLKGVKHYFIGHIFSVFGMYFLIENSLINYSININQSLFKKKKGDIFLEVDPEELFLFGLGSFLIGHVWYVLGFMKSCGRIEVGSLFKHWFIGLFWSLAIFLYLFDTLGEFTIPVFVYALALSFLWMSGSYLSSFRQNFGFVLKISPFLGAFFFSFSDSVIALSKFRPHIFNISASMYIIIITYWLAQLFITLTGIKHHLTLNGKSKSQKKVY